MQVSLVKLYRAWPRLDTEAGQDGYPGIDAYLRRIMVNAQRSWWRARWRRETPAAQLPEGIQDDDAERQARGALVLPRRTRTAGWLRCARSWAASSRDSR